MPVSWLAKLLGTAGGSAISQPVEAIGNVLDKLLTSKEEKLIAQQVMQKLLQQPGIAQIELSKVEAQHRSIFVAGWRPFIGWVAGVGIAVNFIFRPLLNYVLLIKYPTTPIMETLEMGPLMALITGMLGFGALRTYEKVKGRAK